MNKLSKGAEKIRRLIQEEGVNFTIEKTFPDLKSSKGKPCRFDFAIYSDDWKRFVLIEYDGEAHFQRIKHFHKNNTKYLNALGRDRRKNAYCLAHNITLYRVPYWEIDNINKLEDILDNEDFIVKSQYHNDKLIPK